MGTAEVKDELAVGERAVAGAVEVDEMKPAGAVAAIRVYE